MFKLNIKIAIRNLWKYKTASFINIVGLAIGLTACLLLLLYVFYEWNFDRQSHQASQVYKVMSNLKGDDGTISFTHDGTVSALAPAIRQSIPDVKAISRLTYGKQQLIANGERRFKKNAVFAEQDLFKMYDYQFISGDPVSAMRQVRSVVLTESSARLLFGTTQVLGKAVRYQNEYDLMVSGVIKDQPDNSSNKFDFLMPWSLYETIAGKNLTWDNFSFLTLCLLPPNTDLRAVNKKIGTVAAQNASDLKDTFFLYPLAKAHLYGRFENGKSVGGDISKIWLFTGLAVGILLIACINFMNMATAKSERRAKEVGIKKTIGAQRSSLVAQFLTESLVLTLVSVTLAIILLELVLPWFNQLLGVRLKLSSFTWSACLSLAGVVLFTSIAAGGYPALFLSSFEPLKALKGRTSRMGLFQVSLRQVLVTVQFCFAVLLIISTLVIYRQVQYIKSRPAGFDIGALVQIPQEGTLKTKYEVLKAQLLKSGAVSAMFQSSVSLSHHNSNFTDISWEGMHAPTNRTLFNKMAISYDFIKTTGIRMIQGRDFSESFASDSNAVLISASAARLMSFQNATGKEVTIFGDKHPIIGVFDDFVWDSPYQSNNPMIVYLDRGHTGTITMRLSSNGSMTESVNTISRIINGLNPGYPLELNFMSEVYAEKFRNEQKLGILSNLFGGLAIFVSCLGLFGLVSYTAEQRTKEFGVRKVLGATVINIMTLLSVSFLKIVVTALMIGIPVAYYMMNLWLSNFEFHTAVSWWIIALASAGTLGVAALTLSFQAYKSAVSSPVNALKYE